MDRIEDSNRQAKQLDDLIEKIECKRYVRLSSILQSSATCKVFVCPFIFTPTLLLITYSYQHPFRSFMLNLKFLDWICILLHICLVFGCCLSSVCCRFKGMFILSTNLGWHFLYILKVVLFAFTKLIGFLKVPLIKCKSTSVMWTGMSVELPRRQKRLSVLQSLFLVNVLTSYMWLLSKIIPTYFFLSAVCTSFWMNSCPMHICR
jgi:hypothetical protein